jgi:hypothetical protein
MMARLSHVVVAIFCLYLQCLTLVLSKSTPGASCAAVSNCNACVAVKYCYFQPSKSKCVAQEHLPQDFDRAEFVKDCASDSLIETTSDAETVVGEAELAKPHASMLIEAEAVKNTVTDKSGWFEPSYNEEAEKAATKLQQAEASQKTSKLHLVKEFRDVEKVTDDGSSFYYDEKGNSIQPPVKTEQTAASASSENQPVEADGLASKSDDLSAKLEASAEPEYANDPIALEQKANVKHSHATAKASKPKHASASKNADSRLDTMDARLKRIEELLMRNRKRV